MNKDESPSLKKIRTKELKDGMKFTATVYIDKKNIFVAANVPVKQKDIERLLNWGIFELETAGELIPESIQPEEKPSEDGPQRVEAIAKMEADLKKLVEEQLHSRKSLLPLTEPEPDQTQKQNLAKRVTLADFYTSWIESCERQLELARKDARLDRGDVVRVAGEMLKLAKQDSQGLMAAMSQRQKGNHLAAHGTNVAIYGAIIGTRIGIKQESLLNFVIGCYFLDIGMVRVPDSIINKEGRLEIDELKVIHTHPVYGYQILIQQNGFPVEAGMVALEHHEKINGSGYPRKLLGPAISLFGRLAAIIDTYEAMTDYRAYRDEYISHDAMQNLISNAQIHFDNKLLSVFLREVGIYPIGSKVLLNTNAVGIVTATDPSLPMRPEIQIVRDEFGDSVRQPEVVRLANERDLVIVRAIKERDEQDG